MKKLVYLGFLALVALGLNCTLTDYPLIQDEYSGEIINTQGKSKVLNFLQQAWIYPDGSDNLFTMIDQKANGDRTLTAYNFYSTDGTYFYDDLYCSPDWSGCAIYSAPDPEIGDVDPFDATVNENCRGFRSLYSFIAATYRYGECGRAPLTVQERLTLAAAGDPRGENALGYRLHGGNLKVWFDNRTGVRTPIPLLGSIDVELRPAGNGRAIFRVENPLTAYSLRNAADWIDAYDTGATTVTVAFNGVERSFDARLFAGAFRHNAERL